MTEEEVNLVRRRKTPEFVVFREIAGMLADFNKYSVPKTHPFAKDGGDLVIITKSYLLKLKEGKRDE